MYVILDTETAAQDTMVEGANWRHRGQPVGVIVMEDDEMSVDLLGAASMTEACYWVAENYPDNVFIKIILEEGIPNVLTLFGKTPHDFQKWVKEEHNKWHKGASNNFLEVYDDIPDLEASWAKHATSKGITVERCPKKGCLLLF